MRALRVYLFESDRRGPLYFILIITLFHTEARHGQVRRLRLLTMFHAAYFMKTGNILHLRCGILSALA